MTPDVKEKFTEKLGENPRDFFDRRVVRVYSEASIAEDLVKLRTAAKQWIFE